MAVLRRHLRYVYESRVFERRRPANFRILLSCAVNVVTRAAGEPNLGLTIGVDEATIIHYPVDLNRIIHYPLRRSGPFVMSTLRFQRLSNLHKLCNAGIFFLQKNFFLLFFELEFRFTTAVFCLTHFWLAWPVAFE